MAHLVTFPWIDRQEVRNVYQELFSNDVNKQKHAIDRISVWKCRSMNRLPSAVESTASLINARIISENTKSEPTLHTHLHMRNLYSMALIRFVNHVTERGQQSTYARPVHVVASEFGVPEWIVELRHAATHGSLPSLNELMAAVTWALAWLRDKFWEPQLAKPLGVSTLRSAALEMLKQALVTFMQRKFQEINSGDVIASKQLLTDIEYMFEQLGACACGVLLEDGYLIFTETQLKCLGYSYSDLIHRKSLLLPSSIMDFWMNVIQLLIKTDLLAEHMLHMASEVTEVSSLRNTLLCSWIYTIIWHNNRNKTKMKINVELPYKCLLEKCFHLRNSDGESLVNLLVDSASMDVEQKQQLKQFLSICKTSEESCETSSNVEVRSVNDLLNNNTLCSMAWRKCVNQVDWSKLPFGILPNQTLNYKNLELSSDYSVDSAADDTTVQDIDADVSLMPMESAESVVSMNDDESVGVTHANMLQWDQELKQTIVDHLQLF